MRISIINVHVEIKMLILSILIAWMLSGLPWSPAWKWCQGPLLRTSAHVIIQCSHTLRNTQWERERAVAPGRVNGWLRLQLCECWMKRKRERERERERTVKDILNHKRVRGWKIDGHVSSALGAFRAGFSPSLRAHLTSCLWYLFLGIHCGRVWRSMSFLYVFFKSTQPRSVSKLSELPL